MPPHSPACSSGPHSHCRGRSNSHPWHTSCGNGQSPNSPPQLWLSLLWQRPSRSRHVHIRLCPHSDQNRSLAGRAHIGPSTRNRTETALSTTEGPTGLLADGDVGGLCCNVTSEPAARAPLFQPQQKPSSSHCFSHIEIGSGKLCVVVVVVSDNGISEKEIL